MSVPMHSERGWEMLSRPGIRMLVGGVYSFWAGAINCVTTLTIFFERASHVSGRLSDVGMNLVLFPIDALLVFLIWVGFVFGAFLAGKLLDRIGLTPCLLLVAGILTIGALLVRGGLYAETSDDYGFGRMMIAFVIPIAMGFQNSLTSQLPIGRTTHWTGDSTDLGTALAKGNYFLAFYNTLKIMSFICGAAISGYLVGIVGLPSPYELLTIAAAFILVTLILHWVNLTLHKSSTPLRPSDSNQDW